MEQEALLEKFDAFISNESVPYKMVDEDFFGDYKAVYNFTQVYTPFRTLLE